MEQLQSISISFIHHTTSSFFKGFNEDYTVICFPFNPLCSFTRLMIFDRGVTILSCGYFVNPPKETNPLRSMCGWLIKIMGKWREYIYISISCLSENTAWLSLLTAPEHHTSNHMRSVCMSCMQMTDFLSYYMYIKVKNIMYAYVLCGPLLVLLDLAVGCFVWHDVDSVTLRGRCLPERWALCRTKSQNIVCMVNDVMINIFYLKIH